MTKNNSNTYDILIIGGGIAGIYTATEIIKARPKLRVALAEKYKILGGRTFTFYADVSGVSYQWEEGGARIKNNHVLINGLIKKYNLNTIPISEESRYKMDGAHPVEPDLFHPAIPTFLYPLLSLPQETLQKTTIRKLLTEIHGQRLTDNFLERYPYRAEVNIMRADMALELFKNEMRGDDGYSICKEGLSKLIERMRIAAEKKGVTFLVHHELVDVDGHNAHFKHGPPSEGVGREDVVVEATTIVFALPFTALKSIKQFEKLAMSKYLTMAPLLRIYSVFPPLKDGTQWFQDLPRTVSSTHARYIIPANSKKGALQISYTDSIDAVPLMELYKEKGITALETHLLEDVRTLFHKDIPKPLFTKAHPWEDGVTYWLPGDYDPYKVSKEICKPFKELNWFVCGESYSVRQGWIEGALEHAETMLKLLKITTKR